MTNLLTLLFAIMLGPWKALVGTLLWGWFVVPLGGPAVGFVHMYGLLVLAQLAVARTSHSLDEWKSLGKASGEEQMWATRRNLRSAYLVSTFCLVFGAVAHEFL